MAIHITYINPLVRPIKLCCCVFLLFSSLLNGTAWSQTKTNTKKNVVITERITSNVPGIVDSIFLTLVRGGTFQMGSNSDETEQPIHPVTVKSYYMSIYEITQEQWAAVMGFNPCVPECNKCPVNIVSWHEAQEFAAKLSRMTGKHYRLPTEAEWEFAAKGGLYSDHYKYSGSNNPDEVACYANPSSGGPQPCGQKKANELGIYDMSGNVWEWCSDWYDGDYYKQRVSNNPQGPATGIYKVIRGGFYSDYNCCITTTYRKQPNPQNSAKPTDHWRTLGFRIVRECE